MPKTLKITEPDVGTLVLDAKLNVAVSNDNNLDADPCRRCAEIASVALKAKLEASFTVTLLDERHNDEQPEVNSTLPTGVEPKFEECLPNKVTEMAPEVAELVIVVDDNVGVVNDDACENITLRVRPVVTIATAKTPFPADTRHRMEDSDNHSESTETVSPIRTGLLRDE